MSRVRTRWRWSNVPLPERYLGALGIGALLQIVAPLRLLVPSAAQRLGAPLLVAGIGLVWWATASAGDTGVDRSEALVTTGAYGLTRNPMYLGWAAGVLGIALLARSPWLMIAWLHAGGAVHREVLDEEHTLAARFGPAFDAYRARTPRYVGRPPPQRMPVS